MRENVRTVLVRLVALCSLVALVAAIGVAPLSAQPPTSTTWSLQDLAQRLMPAFPDRTCRDEREPVIEQMVRRCYLRRGPSGTDTLELLFEFNDSLTGVYWWNRRFDDDVSAARFVDSLAVDLAGARFERWKCPPDSGNGFTIRTHMWTGPGASVRLGLTRREQASWRLSLSFLDDPSGSAREAFCPLGEKLPESPGRRSGLVMVPFAVSRATSGQ